MSFQNRLIPNTAADEQELLKECGFKNMEDLFSGIPNDLKFKGKLNIIDSLSELEIKRWIHCMTRNSRHTQNHVSFLGAGVYEHMCPSAVNHLTQRGEFLTAYTPYQPEISQGTLQALFEFQTMVANLFGMDVSNASHYDGSTSFTEAALMAMRIKNDRTKILVSQGVHPEYIEVMKTYLINFAVELVIVPTNEAGVTSTSALKSLLSDDVAAVMIQSPNFNGCIEDQEELVNLTQKSGAMFISNVLEPTSLALVKTPGECGADIAVGEGQSFGVPPSFGGPFVGLFTAKQEFVRQMPGRLCGETIDTQGRRSYTLTLSTREQHIRREKATSNICSNQNLIVLWTTIWLSMVGKNGFQQIAEQNLAKAEYAKQKIAATGKAQIRHAKTPTYNEFVVDLKISAKDFAKKAIAKGIAPGLPMERFFPQDKNGLLIAVTETKLSTEIDQLAKLIAELG